MYIYISGCGNISAAWLGYVQISIRMHFGMTIQVLEGTRFSM